MKDELNTIIDYVEGRLGIKAFQEHVVLEKKLQKILTKYAASRNNCIYGKDILKYISQLHDRVADRCSLQEILCGLLNEKNIPYQLFEGYISDYRYLLAVQPSWLDIIDDQGIFDKIIAEAPADVSKTKRIACGKARLKELFRYDKTYPRWVQSPEWPIVNGKPLVFSHQSKEKKDDERVFYYFYDPDTKEETVVEQMY